MILLFPLLLQSRFKKAATGPKHYVLSAGSSFEKKEKSRCTN
ncbi:hypothetical protein ANACOL_00273 [Anaerotruncus colihominis DSM 17241]|uniref:Uncharacterized protein n=1 Tax=Anaerotruncus colihominis DSM 17241 TaxID=445972 RepID=B0P6A1_9FIRM|nr:hypothetical protein ANACOL_00273 [Anaerotruncus colihominis DSM 17241]